MSRVYIRTIDEDGELETVGEAKNSSAFYLGIWGGLLKKHGLHSGYTHDLRVLGKLWSRVARLPRADGLLVAATFDRCWFPRSMIGELAAALRGAWRIDAGNGGFIADVIEHPDIWQDGDRGITFSGSIASPWACSKTDVLHVVNTRGHACRDCRKKIQNAEHMLADRACCREPDEATYSADA